eukprot:symbB.v1.2.015868.t3/scaffold1197.1/size132224/6
MRNTDPWDLFDKSLRGTGMERTPKSRSPRRIDIDDHDLFKLTLAEQPLLPEDPVEAYFQSQDSRIEDCHKKGRISWNPDAEAKKKRTSRPVARARVHSFRDPKAMARVASFLDPQNKEGISAVLCSTGAMTRGQAKLRPQQELRGSLQSTEEFEEIPDRPDLLDQVQRSQKLSPFRRDACQLLRMQHIDKALAQVETEIQPCDEDDAESLLRQPPEWRKRQLRAECRLLQEQLQEKKASEEAFLNNMMIFFKEEDGKSITLRMQIQDLVDQYEELNKHCDQQELEAEALQACLQLMAAYAEDAKQRNTFLIETLTQLLSNQPTIVPGEHNELSRAWEECVFAAYHRLCNDFTTCTDNMLSRRNMFLDRLEDAKRENKEHALQMAVLMQTTTQSREKLDGFKRRYFWDSSSHTAAICLSESLKAPRVPKLPLADTPDLEPPSLSRKDPEHFLEDVPEMSEDMSPQSSKSREKQPEQEPDCVQVQASPPSAFLSDQHLQCQRHLHSLLPQAVPMQHHRMCSPQRIPVYATQTVHPAGWQFQSRPPQVAPTFVAEPCAVRTRVSVSPPRVVAPAQSAQLLGTAAGHVQWCSGASVRVPSPVPEGVRAEPRCSPRWSQTGAGLAPKRGSCPCPLTGDRARHWHTTQTRTPRASHPSQPMLRAPLTSPRYQMSFPDPVLRGRATVPTIASPSPCQFSPQGPCTVRSPSPLRFDACSGPALSRAASPLMRSRCYPVRINPEFLQASQAQQACTKPGSWELPSGRSPPAPQPSPRPFQGPVVATTLPTPPILRLPMRSPSPVDVGRTPQGRVESYAIRPPVNPASNLFAEAVRFVFGAVGNESCKTKRDRENVFFESCGAKDDMLKLIRAWDKIDPEDSGRVEVAEVQRFADRLMIDVSAAQAWHESNDLCVQQDPQRISSRMPIWLANTSPEEWPRFVQRLSERLTAVLQASRKSSFCFEDLMRLIWPCSPVEDLKQMSGWCEEINNTRDKFQVSPPPAVFDHFDQDGGGKISTNELIMSGLVDKEGKAAAETGEIGLKDFCEMLCPHGYRATEQSVIGSTALGRVARLDKTTKTWRLKDAKPIAAVRYRYSSFGRGSRLNLGIVPGQK